MALFIVEGKYFQRNVRFLIFFFRPCGAIHFLSLIKLYDHEKSHFVFNANGVICNQQFQSNKYIHGNEQFK